MEPRRVPLLLVLLLLIVIAAVPSRGQTPPPVEVTRLSDSLHQITCNGQVAVVASTGPDGVLLVDSGYAATAEAVQAALNELAPPGRVRVIVNTHGDGDHVGGNALLGQDAVILGHDAVRRQMGSYFALPIERADMPIVTVGDEDEVTLHFNGEAIHLRPLPGGHTAGDLIVHFTGSRLVCLGDLVLQATFPNADPGRGGDARRLLEVLRELQRTLPKDVTLVPAHGERMDLEGLQAYIEMVEGTIEAVEREVDAGRSLPEILERRPLAAWAQWARPDRRLSIDDWTREIHASLSGEFAPSICAPMTERLAEGDLAGAVATYRRLKAEEPDAWRFGENELNALGYQLLQSGRVDEAIEVFELNVEAFPEAFNPYDSLGEAYMAAGSDERAMLNYERSLALNPDNTNATTMLKRIRSRSQP